MCSWPAEEHNALALFYQVKYPLLQGGVRDDHTDTTIVITYFRIQRTGNIDTLYHFQGTVTEILWLATQ